MHYPCSENKGADQLRGYRILCFRICKKPVFKRSAQIEANRHTGDTFPSKSMQGIIMVNLYSGTSRKVPKFSDARKLCYNLPIIQEKRPNLCVFLRKEANGITNSEDPDQTAPLGAI